MRTRPDVMVALLTGLLTAVGFAADGMKKTWNFDDDKPGEIAKGFTNEVGKWVVAKSDKGKRADANGEESQLDVQRDANQRHECEGRGYHRQNESRNWRN